MRRWIVGALVLVGCGGAEIETTDPAQVALEALIKAQMREGGIPGAGVAIIRNGEVYFQQAYGLANVEARTDITLDTGFIVASVSKTVVGTTLMQLVESGDLDLDADLDSFLPFSIRHPDHPDKPITTRMFMTHTSGLRDDWIQLGRSTSNGDSDMTLREFTEGYVSEGGRLNNGSNWGNEPGTEHDYTNAGFGVLGYIAEVAAGTSLPNHAKANIFAPLSMSNTGWHLRDVDEANLAIPYAGDWKEGLVASKHQGYGFYPATGLRTSIRDLSKFALAHMRGGALDGTRIMSEGTTKAMHTYQPDAIWGGQALVWQRDRINGNTYLGHTGSTVGGSAIVALDLEGDIAILLITNSDAYVRNRFGKPEGRDAINRIVEALDVYARTGS